MQLSIFDFIEPVKILPGSNSTIVTRMNEMLKDYKEQYQSDIDTEIVDYVIHSASSNQYLPENTALLHIYILTENYTATILMMDRAARENHAEWVHERARHTVCLEIPHTIRADPESHVYSLDDHIDHTFKSTVEINGLKISTRTYVDEAIEIINKHEW